MGKAGRLEGLQYSGSAPQASLLQRIIRTGFEIQPLVDFSGWSWAVLPFSSRNVAKMAPPFGIRKPRERAPLRHVEPQQERTWEAAQRSLRIFGDKKKEDFFSKRVMPCLFGA